MSDHKDYKKIGSFRHPEDDYHHSVWQHKSGTYHHEDEHGGYPDGHGYKSLKEAHEGFKKFHSEFNQREGDQPKDRADKFASGYKFHPHGENLHKAEAEAIDALAKSEPKAGFHYHRQKAADHGATAKHHWDRYEDDSKSSDPEIKHGAKEHLKHADKHERMATEHLNAAQRLHDEKKHGPWNLTIPKGNLIKKSEHPEFEKHKGKIQEIVGMSKKDMFKAEKDAIDEYMKKSSKEYQRVKGVHTSGGFSGLEERGQSQAGNEITSRAPKAGNKYLKEMHHERGKEMHREKLRELREMPKPNLTKSEDKKDFGVRSFDHRKKSKDPSHRTYGKHWTVAHTAPKADHGYHTHTHHFDTAHEATKYAQKWEDTVGQHNNDRPEILGPEHDEK